MKKSSVSLVFVLAFLVSFAQNGLNQKVHFNSQKGSILEHLKTVEAQTDLTFSYGSQVDVKKNITLAKSEYTVQAFLEEVFGDETRHKLNRSKVILYPKPSDKKSGGRSTISGYVKDANGGENLIGANIFDTITHTGTVTNLYGFFSHTVPNASRVALSISYLGYHDTLVVVDPSTASTLTVELKEVSRKIGAVVVEASRQQETQMSTVSVTSEEIAKMPRFMGEPDVLKTLALMPGVKSSNDNTGGMYVRGGGPDQNLILLDGATIYNSAHAFDLFSTFNNSAIKHVDLIKGGFPARYGGRLSSVIDARMREGNMQHFTGEIGVGYLLSKFTVEGPIIKNKASFLISGRRTLLDGLTKFAELVTREDSFQQTQTIRFQDFNGKVNYMLSNKDRFYLSFYNSGDLFRVTENIIVAEGGTTNKEHFDVDLHWSNSLVSGRWNHVFSPKLFSNTTATYSKFDIGVNVLEESTITYNNEDVSSGYENRFSSLIKDYGVRTQFDYFPNPKHKVKFGANGIYHQFEPGFTSVKISGTLVDNELDTVLGKQALASVEWSLFAEDEIELSSHAKMNVGLHQSMLHVKGKSYPSIQPRFALNYQIKPKLSFSVSYAEMTQFIHLLTNNTLGIPLDLWVPATQDAPPMRSRQVAGGIKWTLGKGMFEMTTEGYYKSMTNLIAYKEGVSITSAKERWEDKIVTDGVGHAYGIEWFFQKRKGKTTGWLGYTLSWSDRTFEDVNSGRTYPHKYDRRHDASVVIAHQLNERISLSGSWVFATGNAVTFPHTVSSPMPTLPHLQNPQMPGRPVYVSEGRNAVRLPNYHRLDLGINFEKVRRRGIRTWNLSVYNAYVRKNPFFVFPAQQSDGTRYLRQISAFWIVPSLSYIFKFN